MTVINTNVNSLAARNAINANQRSLQTAMQSLMLENIQLRQVMAKNEVDMEAAEELLSQASRIIEHLQCEQQSPKTKWRLWPW